MIVLNLLGPVADGHSNGQMATGAAAATCALLRLLVTDNNMLTDLI